MDQVGVIARYLDELASALRVGWLRKRRIVREIEEHLRDECAAAQRAGATPAQAEQLAVARLGPAAALAAQFADALSDRRGKAQTRALCLPAAAAGALFVLQAVRGLTPPAPVTADSLQAEGPVLAAAAHRFVAPPTAPARARKLGLPRVAAREPGSATETAPATVPEPAPATVAVAAPAGLDLTGALLAGLGTETVRVSLPVHPPSARAPAAPAGDRMTDYHGYRRTSTEYLLVLIDRKDITWTRWR